MLFFSSDIGFLGYRLRGAGLTQRELGAVVEPRHHGAAAHRAAEFVPWRVVLDRVPPCPARNLALTVVKWQVGELLLVPRRCVGYLAFASLVRT